MKIAITGNTRGFGKYMFDRLAGSGHEVIGFSKSNGVDITHPGNRKFLIKQIEDCDVFINNAQEGFSQTEMLYDLFFAWRGSKKLIINIGSNARDFTNRDQPYSYSVQKLALNHASKQLGRSDICKVVTVDFGFLTRDDGSVIGYENAYEYVDIALQTLNKNYRLLEILVAHE